MRSQNALSSCLAARASHFAGIFGLLAEIADSATALFVTFRPRAASHREIT
jgi:hypothetical protein